MMSEVFSSRELTVNKNHCDWNDHLNISNYLSFYNDATFLFLKEMGFDSRKDERNINVVVSKIFTLHKKELFVGDTFFIKSNIIDFDNSNVVVIHKLKSNGVLMSKCYFRLDFIDKKTRMKLEVPKSLLKECDRFYMEGAINVFKKIIL
tara:strand:+ start:38 stop:484 length:447 start_codon:yes stop_codon:yes gene_type:complete